MCIRDSSGGTRTFNGAVTTGTLNILGASTAFNAATSFATGQISSGSLGGSGSVTATSSLAWTGGTMNGTGKTIIAPGAALSISGAGVSLQREVENNGDANWTTGNVTFTAGTFTNQVGAVLNAESTGSFTGSGTLANLGSVQRSAMGTGTVSGLAITNTGTIGLTQGVLLLVPAGGTFSNNGAISAAAGTTLEVTGNLIQGASSSMAISIASNDPTTGSGHVLASGSVQLNGALSLTVLNAYTPNGANWFVRGASLSGRFSTVSLPPTVFGITPRLSFSGTGVTLKFSGFPFIPASP